MRTFKTFAAAALVACLFGLSALPAKARDEKKELDVPYVPTPTEVVEKMLELAAPKKGEIMYDLGCGDGRIVIAAAKKYGTKSTGFDIDPDRIKECGENVKKEKKEVQELCKFEKKDIFTVDLSGVNVLTIYLLPSVNEKLIPQIKKMKAGSRVVSHQFRIKGYKPDKTVVVKDKDGYERDVLFFTLPLKEEKE